MTYIEKRGYRFEPVYSDLNNSGLLHITKDGTSVRELHFECAGVHPTDEEIHQAINAFFDHLGYDNIYENEMD